jgi:DNA-directed RNA polymerase subunit alpha
MEQTINFQIDLFADKLPAMDEIRKLSDFIHSSEYNLLAFKEQLEQNLSQTGAKRNDLAAGIGLVIIGRNKEAIEKLEKAKDCKEKFIYLAMAQRKTGLFEQANESFQKSLEYQADPFFVSLEKTANYRRTGNFEAGEKELKKNSNYENVSAEYHYQLGRLQEAEGLYEQAVENYKTALELAPEHQRALFYLAFRCDIAGDEEAAIDYYKQITSSSPVYVSALLNLAVLYEDSDQYEKASECINKVLESHPNHPRALLFKKDIESSKTMFYDEEKEKKKTRRNQLLETPITDFELSVRSRNCLKKMNIRTVGDLMKTTESDLLAFKNFGETSLKEIKAILSTKGLFLGMAIEEQTPQAVDEPPAPVVEENQGLLNKPVDELQLSVRAKKCLQKLNLHTIKDLTQKTEAELLGVKNFGVTSLNEIKKALTNLGLSLRTLD